MARVRRAQREERLSRHFRLRIGVVTAAIAVLTAVSVALGLASLGGAGPTALGATLNASGTVRDDETVYTFNLQANEAGPRAGEGTVNFSLDGPEGSGRPLRVCTLTGGSTTPGSTPTASCGTAGFQAVSIDGCKATIEAHGFAHSDFPHEAIYMGPMTYGLEFEKLAMSRGKLKVVVYTPKKKLEVAGNVNAFISMSTCP